MVHLSPPPLADVNECYDTKRKHSCDQICINTHGSYECQCGHGYGRGVDGHSCYGEWKWEGMGREGREGRERGGTEKSKCIAHNND